MCGMVAGTLGGMGMGGGTLLIPLLTILLGFNQKIAQAINLISFSIMAMIVIIFHIKNKLIDVKIALIFASFSLATSILGALLASVVDSSALRVAYGILLIGIAIYEAICQVRTSFGNKKDETKK